MIIIKNIFNRDVKKITGCGSAWLERLVWDQEVAGSNPVTPTTDLSVMQECRNWQTSKTKDLVSNALVWVQVPSPAFSTNGVDEMSTPFCVRSRACLEPKFKVYAPLRSAQSRRPPDVLRPISCIFLLFKFTF